MFIYCYDAELKEKLVEEGNRLIHSGTNSTGNFWVLEKNKNFQFSKEYKEKEKFYTLSNRLTF